MALWVFLGAEILVFKRPEVPLSVTIFCFLKKKAKGFSLLSGLSESFYFHKKSILPLFIKVPKERTIL
jgi:hypothetical protein